MKTSSLPIILHICKVYIPVKGGVQRVVQGITTALPNFFHCVVTTGLDGAIRQQRVDEGEIFRCRAYAEIASMPIAPSLLPLVFSSARKASLIALHYPFPLAEAALSLTPFTPPIVVHWHSEVIAQRKLKWLVAPITLVILLRAKAIIVTSQRMLPKSFLLKLFQRKIHYIPYGIPPAVLTAPITHPGPDYFLLIGRHVSYKGIDVAIRSMQKINCRLVIVGDGPLFEQHEKLVNDLGLSNKITFERYANDQQVTAKIVQSLALVVPSVRENEAFALVQLEAMRLGKPIINTNLQSSVPWVARHQQEAITVPPANIEALASAMQALLEDAPLRKRLGDKALERFKGEFTADRFATRVDQLYSSLIQKEN